MKRVEEILASARDNYTNHRDEIEEMNLVVRAEKDSLFDPIIQLVNYLREHKVRFPAGTGGGLSTVPAIDGKLYHYKAMVGPTRSFTVSVIPPTIIRNHSDNKLLRSNRARLCITLNSRQCEDRKLFLNAEKAVEYLCDIIAANEVKET